MSFVQLAVLKEPTSPTHKSPFVIVTTIILIAAAVESLLGKPLRFHIIILVPGYDVFVCLVTAKENSPWYGEDRLTDRMAFYLQVCLLSLAIKNYVLSTSSGRLLVKEFR